MSMYIRLKRHNTTVFMHCEPADNFASVKAKAGKLMGIDPAEMGLFTTRDKARELVDLATIGDQEISNDQILFVVKRSDIFELVVTTISGDVDTDSAVFHMFSAGDGYEEVSVANSDGMAPSEGNEVDK